MREQGKFTRQISKLWPATLVLAAMCATASAADSGRLVPIQKAWLDKQDNKSVHVATLVEYPTPCFETVENSIESRDGQKQILLYHRAAENSEFCIQVIDERVVNFEIPHLSPGRYELLDGDRRVVVGHIDIQ